MTSPTKADAALRLHRPPVADSLRSIRVSDRWPAPTKAANDAYISVLFVHKFEHRECGHLRCQENEMIERRGYGKVFSPIITLKPPIKIREEAI